MKKKRKMVVIAEPNSELAATLLPWLVEKGYRFQAVDNVAGFIFISLISRNKISVMLLDDSVGEGTLCEDIAIIKRMFGNVPIIVTTEENHPEKEKCIRNLEDHMNL